MNEQEPNIVAIQSFIEVYTVFYNNENYLVDINFKESLEKFRIMVENYGSSHGRVMDDFMKEQEDEKDRLLSRSDMYKESTKNIIKNDDSHYGEPGKCITCFKVFIKDIRSIEQGFDNITRDPTHNDNLLTVKDVRIISKK